MKIYVHWDREAKAFFAGWNPPAGVDYAHILEIDYDESADRPELLVAGEELGVL